MFAKTPRNAPSAMPTATSGGSPSVAWSEYTSWARPASAVSEVVRTLDPSSPATSTRAQVAWMVLGAFMV